MKKTIFLVLIFFFNLSIAQETVGLVFDDINDLQRLLTSGFENGDLQDNKVNDIAFDKEGAVWMVGRAGVSIFQSPETIFEGGENNDASKLTIV